MRIIQTTAIVTEDGQLHVPAPPDMASGEHRVVIILEDSVVTEPEIQNGSASDDAWPMPVHDVGPWPEGLSLSREDMYDDWGR